MSETNNHRDNIRKLEFWAATALYVFGLFFLISAALSDDWAIPSQSPIEMRNRINYFFVSNLIQYTMLYLAFLWLNFRIIPRLIEKESVFLNIALMLFVMLLIWVSFGSSETWLKEYITSKPLRAAELDMTFQKTFFEAARTILIIGFYAVVREFCINLLANAEALQAKYKYVRKDSLVAAVVWALIMFLLLATYTEPELTAAWGTIIPCSILLYTWSFQYLIPKMLIKKRPFASYFFRMLLVLILAMPLVFLLGYFIAQEEETGAMIMVFGSLFQLFVMVPFTWLAFKKQMKGNEELYKLKRELGQSHANLDFLRSQINPHFLFNALNTIYGTAIQEKAERTSEGVEKLGDMMRFMLQENMQEKIALAREVDYLNNYISLQRLRTDPNPGIQIDASIAQPVNPIEIAPMLLIPFVENAFKHGISFRENSQIKISLEVKEGKLYFDVFNTRHQRTENDPEKDRSGIGLSNVRQRLQLIYPGKHELVIRETPKDFFVHLIIHLK